MDGAFRGRKDFLRNERPLTKVQKQRKEIYDEFIYKLKPYNVTRLAKAYVFGRDFTNNFCQNLYTQLLNNHAISCDEK